MIDCTADYSHLDRSNEVYDSQPKDNNKVSHCKSRQHKIESDKFKIYYWHKVEKCCLLVWRQNVTYATVGCEIVTYYSNNIQKGVYY